MLAQDGRKVGLFTSPHLMRFTERIRIGGAEVGREALAGRHARVAAVAPPGLTMFEMVTLLGLQSFAEEGCDAVVLEVGLGGRLDATNVVDAEVAVVTGVALDHQEVLGPDLAAIAREKAGIFKPGRTAIVGGGGEPEAVPVLVEEARRRGATVRVVDCALPAGMTVALEGRHQVCNAACALAAAEALGVPEAARRAGLAAARWPGRIERIGRVILDAAHNPQAARALAAALAGEPRPKVLLVAVSGDKDAAGIVAPLLPGARALLVTEAPSTRAMPAERLAAACAGAEPAVEIIGDWRAALARAQALAGEDGVVVACGSIFLVGAVRALLLGEETDPVALADPAKVAPR
jgi:dihydrofolate synthase/folylpolyglutamate synthase